jgi:hypothetical protein
MPEKIGPEGTEHPADLPKEIAISETGGAPVCAFPSDDPQLSLVVQAWPKLSAEVRLKILAIAAQ